MNGIEFLEMINDIDPDLIDMAARKSAPAQPSGQKKKWVLFAVPVAAVAAVAAAALLIIGLSLGGKAPKGEDPSAIVASHQARESTSETKTPEETTSSTAGNTDNNANKPSSASDTVAPAGDNSQIDGHPEEPGYSNNDNQDHPYNNQNSYNDQTGQEGNDIYDNDPDSENTDNPTGSDQPAQPEYRVMFIEFAIAEVDADLQSEDESLIYFWEDDYYAYYMDQKILSNATVIYESGEYEDLISALSNGHIEISDLDTYGIPYYVE